MKKRRLDQLLTDRGLAPSREKAQRLILAGQVLVNDQPETKPGHQFLEDSDIRVRSSEHDYVSRGGMKLAHALEQFHIDCSERFALDVGASTGGFTEVLLLKGAKQVTAIDVGHNQMDWRLRQDPRVVLIEGVNARYLTYDQIGLKMGLVVVDVSFISLEKIIPALVQFMDSQTDLITLIKPQFEVGPEKVGKKGIVREEGDRLLAVERITAFMKNLGFARLGLIESPITGTGGNVEYLGYWKLKP